MIRCAVCKRESADAARFCVQCGEPLVQGDDLFFWRHRALHLSGQEKIREAIAACKKVLEAEQRDPVIFKALGLLFYKLGDIGASIENYQKALALKADFADAHYYLGISHYRGAAFGRAVEHFRRCLEIDPDFHMAEYWLGLSFYHMGDIEASVAAYGRALERNPQLTIAHYHIGIALSAAGKHEEAITHFRQVAAASAEDGAVHYHLGLAYYRSGRLSEALRHFHHAVELNPGDLRSQNMAAFLSSVPEL